MYCRYDDILKKLIEKEIADLEKLVEEEKITEEETIKTLLDKNISEKYQKKISEKYQMIIENHLEEIYKRIISLEEMTVIKQYEDIKEFEKSNYERWKLGFHKLEMLRFLSIEVGIEFQKYLILKFPEYKNSPLLHVLTTQHANACRITGEIILLLKGGYADGALSRWRTLFEIVVVCLVIHESGEDAAVDYIKHGKIKAIEEMEEYQKTAQDMNLKPYEEQELRNAIELKDRLSNGEKHYHWAKKYTGGSKTGKLREHVGLSKWSRNYKWASKYVHASYYEMRSLSAMSEAESDGLLVGPSSSGMAEPAHFTAISLMQITGILLTTNIHSDKSLNYAGSQIYLRLIEKYVNDVGNAFFKKN